MANQDSAKGWLILALLWFLLFPMASTASATQPVPEQTLALGSWGADVFYLQQRLVEAGYDLTVDGHFGPATRRAIIAFQLDNGLTPDGIAGPKTLEALTDHRPVYEYVVQPGDTLSEIAALFNIQLDTIVELNDIENPSLIRVGELLRIPVISLQ